MSVVNLDKKILIGIILVIGVILVAATFVFQSKRAQDQAESGARPAPVGNSTSGVQASDSIAVGSPRKDDTPSKIKSATREVTWEELYKLDYKTGVAPESVKKLHNSKVRIPGFIVPLSDDMRALKEFLLVPNAQACIHVPPPPPNLIVYVVLNRPIPIEQVTNPSWIEGTLLIEKSESDYGAAGYKMKADKMEEYKF